MFYIMEPTRIVAVYVTLLCTGVAGSTLSRESLSHPHQAQLRSNIDKGLTLNQARDPPSAQQAPPPDKSFALLPGLTCQRKINQCYYNFNTAASRIYSSSTKENTQMCTIVLTLANCLTNLPECGFPVTSKHLLIKEAELRIHGTENKCWISHDGPVTKEATHAGTTILPTEAATHFDNTASTTARTSHGTAGAMSFSSTATMKLPVDKLYSSTTDNPQNARSPTAPSVGGRETSMSSGSGVFPHTPSDLSTTQSDTSPVSDRICDAHHIRCDNGKCVHQDNICDDIDDCGDGSDENGCGPSHFMDSLEIDRFLSSLGCESVVESCSSLYMAPLLERSLEDLDLNPNLFCEAARSLIKCILFDSCPLSEANRTTVRSLLQASVNGSVLEQRCELGLSTSTTTTTPAATTSCVASCQGQPSGDYQSCKGCHVYVTCSNGLIYDNRPCPASLVWDDDVKRCERDSTTCLTIV